MYQIVMAVVSARPRNASTHPWHRSSRHGVVTVERAPGVARDAASRPLTPEERENLKRSIVEEWERGESSARDIAQRHNVSRNTVLGITNRAGARRRPGATRVAAESAATIARARRNRWILGLLGSSWSVRETAHLFSVSEDTVRSVKTRARLAGTLPTSFTATRSANRTTTAIACEGVDRVALMDALPGQCRSLGDDGLCCCKLVVPGRSWCPEHLAMYTLRPVRRSA